MLPPASASHSFVQNAALPHKWGHCKQCKLNPLSLNCVSIEKLLMCGQNSLLNLDEANDGHMRTQQPWLYRLGNDNCLGYACSLSYGHISAVVSNVCTRHFCLCIYLRCKSDPWPAELHQPEPGRHWYSGKVVLFCSKSCIVCKEWTNLP